MCRIKEHLNVDFYFDVRQMSDQDQKRVGEFIKKKKERKNQRGRSKSDSTTNKTLSDGVNSYEAKY